MYALSYGSASHAKVVDRTQSAKAARCCLPPYEHFTHGHAFRRDRMGFSTAGVQAERAVQTALTIAFVLTFLVAPSGQQN